MSPEQASGDGHHVDGRSDIYSLGVILYQLLTGELPFKGSPRALLHQTQYDDPPTPRRLAKDIPTDIETICMKAMVKTLNQRYATAKALAYDLRRFVNDEPILANPPRFWNRGLRWIKRSKRTITNIVMAAIIILGGSGIFVTLKKPKPIEPEDFDQFRTLKINEEPVNMLEAMDDAFMAATKNRYLRKDGTRMTVLNDVGDCNVREVYGDENSA